MSLSVILQKSIKDNSEELQDFLRDLKIWEKDIKKEDTKLSEKEKTNKPSSEEVLPIRNKQNIVQETPLAMAQSQDEKIEKKSNTRISSCDYDAWEKFDVDEALNSDLEEGESETLSQKTPQNCKSQTEKKESLRQGKEKVVTEPKQPTTTKSTSQTTPNDVTSHHKERAEKLKEEGNAFYSMGKLSDAVAKYTQGIGLNPSNPILPANRAMAYIKLKKFKAAEKDCIRALQLDPKYIKAYLRRATIRVHLANFSGAMEDYEKVLQFEPWNKDARKELEKLQKESCHQLDNNQKSRHSPQQLTKDGENKNSKKLKVKESAKENTNIIPAVTKPLHLLSTKPLTDIPVVEVKSKEEMESLLNKPKVDSVSIPVVTKIKPPTQLHRTEKVKKDVSQPSVPQPPKTSHQFSQDWRKVVKFEDLALTYLKRIPPTFFNGTEIEVDELVEVVHTLCLDGIEDVAVTPIMKSLMKCRGFYLNIAFLETKQKEVFEQLVIKMENCEAFKEELQQLKDAL